MKRLNPEEIVIALSIANLLFIGNWRKLLFPSAEAYHLKLEPYPTDYLAIILNVLLTALFFILGVFLIRYFFEERASFLIKVFFLLVNALVLNGIRHQISELYPNSYHYLNLIVLVGICTIGILSFLKWDNYFLDFARWFDLLLAPLLIFTLAFGFWKIVLYPSAAEIPIENQLSAIPAKEKPAIKSRVIWIIFDELDYSVPFEKRPVPLPEFERLKQNSFFATNAIPPAYTTRDATASLLTGKKVETSQAIGKDDLSLKFAGRETGEKFSQTPNIFQKVKALRGETAIVGWLHPYGRVLGQDLSACQWQSVDTYVDFAPLPLGKIIIRNFQNLLISLPFGARLENSINQKLTESAADQGYLKRHAEMMQATHSVITNSNIDLAFIHLPFPHPPNYYNAEKSEFDSPPTKKTSRAHSYLDNLILTDKMLGEIRKNLETSGLWDNSTVIVSSDHQWRVNVYRDQMSEKEFEITGGAEDGRVPFFLKLKGQKESFIYDTSFNTVITQDLILALMKGEVSNLEEVKTWMEKNSGP